MDDLKVTITYLGKRERSEFDTKPWPNHAYTVTIQLGDRTADFPFRTGTGWKREPEEWLAEIRFAPDYIKNATIGTDPRTGDPRFSKAIRDRFYAERDEELRRAVLRDFAFDLEMDEDNSDDDLATDLEMLPSQIKAFRNQCATLRYILRSNRVQEFIEDYRED